MNPLQPGIPLADPFIAALHSLDRRAEKSFAEELLLKTPENVTSLRQKISKIRDSHPELNEPMQLFLKQFPTLLLQCKEQKFSVPLRLAPELSMPLSSKSHDHWKTPSQPVDLSEYDPKTITLLLDIFTGKEIAPAELVSHALELLSLTDLWQFEKISQDLGAIDPDILKEIDHADIHRLIAGAKTHHNLLFYVALLQFAARDAALVETLEPAEKELICDPLFLNNVSRAGSYVVVKAQSVDEMAIYQKLCAFERSLSGGKLAVELCPNQVITGPLLLAAQHHFTRFGFPEKLVLRAATCNFENLQALLACAPNSRLESIECHRLKSGDRLVELLPANVPLKALTLENVELSNRGALALGRYLGQLTTLETLSLRKNALSSAGLEPLVSALLSQRALRQVDLAENHLDHLAPAQFKALLSHSKAFTTLDLSKNTLQDEGARELAALLQQPHSLENLILANCGIGDGGVKELCQSQIHNPLLYGLDLSANPLTDNGVPALSKWLETGLTVDSLNLANTALTDKGAYALVEGLQNNHTLRSLNLSETAIGNTAAFALADLLQKNPTLYTLLLMSTQIGDEGAERLLQAIGQNPRFEFIQLSYTQVSESFTERHANHPRLLI